jgi:hypothetical protein
MRLKIASSRNGLLALTVIAALSICASAALAGNGNGRGHKKGYGHGKSRGGSYTVRYRQPERVYVHPTRVSVRYRQPQRVYVRQPQRVYVQRPQVVRYEACAPRYVTYRPQHVILVRPAPYVRVGAHIGSIDISAIFGPKRRYSSYDYGCNFCEAHFTSYGGYESHVRSCDHRPQGSRIECEDWDESGYDEYRRGGHGRYDDRYEERDRGDYRDDDRYDDRGDYRSNDGYDDDGYYDDDDR